MRACQGALTSLTLVRVLRSLFEVEIIHRWYKQYPDLGYWVISSVVYEVRAAASLSCC